jgi:phage antirepressor YoqD-like protein
MLDMERELDNIVNEIEHIKKAPSKELLSIKAEKSLQTSLTITLKDLCKELKASPKKFRRWLRHNSERQDGRWEWKNGSKELAEIRKNYK